MKTTPNKLRKTAKLFLWAFFMATISHNIYAQEDLLAEVIADDESTTYVDGTFKGVKVINSSSTDLQPKGELLFLITHRFGALNSGFKKFYGLDEAAIRLGFAYGITDRLVVGIGRSGQQVTFDGYAQYKLLRQSTGKKTMPISMVWQSSMAYRDEDFGVSDFSSSFSDRLAYTHQLLISRKFNSRFSLQISPTFTHNNIREFDAERHDQWFMGTAARLQLTKRTAILADYYYSFNRERLSVFTEPLAFAVEFQTGGHVFQLIFSNSTGMAEKLFLTRTTGDWLKGDIHFGFNISRTFPTNRKKARRLAGVKEE